MRIAAGVDVGNATTEVVLARVSQGIVEVIGVGRAPTRRAKGSPESLDAAVALVRRLEHQYGVKIDGASAAPLRPVSTLTATLPEPEEATGRLRVVRAGVGTAGGRGFGVARPHRLGNGVRGDEAVVAVVPAGMGYVAAVPLLRELLAAGQLAAVLVADDEAVLVGNRLGSDVPVVDEIDTETVLAAERVAVEVAEPGAPLLSLADPLRLMSAFRLSEAERSDAAHVVSRLHDTSNAVVSLGKPATVAADVVTGWVEVSDLGRLPFALGHEAVRSGPVGLARAYAVPPADTSYAVDDLWTVDLSAVGDTVLTRSGGAGSRAIGLAALRADAPYADPSPALAERLGVPVQAAPSEAAAGRGGAMSTPGAAADTVVLDLGAGTVDAVSGDAAVVAAGGGELLTVSVAALTGATAAGAEWVKRGSAARVEAPQILLAEDGTREFLDRPAAPETIGALVVRGPAGLLPFNRVLAPGEWRALRLRLKVELLGGNAARALRTLGTMPSTVVVVGGPAGDDEVLSALSRALPPGTAVGRGDVGGGLGHRYAVAYGLLLDLRD
ncbi:MAG: diol dehydratase reactivase ATPase-like domain-containing protein [Sporichthyaceae bacterium]